MFNGKFNFILTPSKDSFQFLWKKWNAYWEKLNYIFLIFKKFKFNFLFGNLFLNFKNFNIKVTYFRKIKNYTSYSTILKKNKIFEKKKKKSFFFFSLLVQHIKIILLLNKFQNKFPNKLSIVLIYFSTVFLKVSSLIRKMFKINFLSFLPKNGFKKKMRKKKSIKKRLIKKLIFEKNRANH